MRRIKRVVCALAVMFFVAGLGTSILAADQNADPQKNCPVMGGAISKDTFRDYNGKRVYFCCAGCPADFDKDPEKYIKKLEAQGVTLEAAPGN